MQSCMRKRDVLKHWEKEHVDIALYGIENQTQTDKFMPFRVIGYDGALYRAQLLNDNKNIVPVVTLVLYFGTEKRWNQKRTVKELMRIPEGLDKYVNDYKIHVFEIAWLTDEQLQMFQSDFGIVANFFVQKRRNKDYEPDDERVIQHVDEVLKLLSVMSKDNKYERLLYNDGEKGEVTTMCEVAERLVNKGENLLATLISKLLLEGRNEDVELAVNDENARKKLYEEFGLTK